MFQVARPRLRMRPSHAFATGPSQMQIGSSRHVARANSVCNDKAGAARKLCIITGGTSGIGRSVVAHLLAEWSDHRIILMARPSPRINQLRALPGANERLSVVNGDLASLRSIAQACDQILGMLGSD